MTEKTKTEKQELDIRQESIDWTLQEVPYFIAYVNEYSCPKDIFNDWWEFATKHPGEWTVVRKGTELSALICKPDTIGRRIVVKVHKFTNDDASFALTHTKRGGVIARVSKK